MTTTAGLRQLLQPYLAAEGLDLDDVELTGQGNSRVLRVSIEGENLDVERLAEVSRGISRALDNESDLDDAYQLEVTTPGLERKLRRPEQFVKSLGREVEARIKGPDSKRTVRGVLAKADANTFTVEADSGAEVFSYDDVVKANTVFRWEKAPKPGH